MASYAAFYLAGMYPLPATGQILLSSPYFPQISFFNPTFNKTTTIKSTGFQGNPAGGMGGSVFVKVCFIPCFRVANYDVISIRMSERDHRRHAVEVQLLYRVGRVQSRIVGGIGVDG